MNLRAPLALLAGLWVGFYLPRRLISQPDSGSASVPLRIRAATHALWPPQPPPRLRQAATPPPPPPSQQQQQQQSPRRRDDAQQPAPSRTADVLLLGGVGPFDLDTRRGLRAAVAARTVAHEIVTLTSNVNGLAAAANMALQLRRHGILQHMVLADERATCEAGNARWAWLGCGYSAGLPGFERAYRDGIGGSTAHLWSLWSAKWLLVARLTELRVNILALDTDMVLQANPYPLLNAPPISAFQMVIAPEGSRVNLGFIYVRGQRCAPTGGIASVSWDVVRRLRLFTEEWPLRSRNNRTTSTYGLWDQGLFTDAITSAVSTSRTPIYPYTYLQSPKTCARRVVAGRSEAGPRRPSRLPWRACRLRWMGACCRYTCTYML